MAGTPAGHLRRGAELARLFLDQRRIRRVGRVRRQHVVVGVDDADVGRAIGTTRSLSLGGDAGEGVVDVGAPMRSAPGRLRGGAMR
jgi:hypothetical protein